MLIMVLIANPGKIPDRTPGDFGCREDFDRKEFCFPSQIPATLPPRIPARLPPGSCRDFGRRDPASRQESRQDSHRDPAEILAAGNPVSRQESRQDSRRDPAEILAAGNPVSRQESRQDSRRGPAEILAAGNPASRQESRQDSRRDPAKILAAGNPAFPSRIPVRIPAAKISAGSRRESWRDLGKIPPRSRYHFYKGWLFVINFALFTDCETNLKKCAMTSLKGRALTTMLSLRSLRSPLIFTILSLLILEA